MTAPQTVPVFANVLYEVDDALALITINRPDKMNAISLATLDDLRAALAPPRMIRRSG